MTEDPVLERSPLLRRITVLKNRNLLGAFGLTSLLVATTGCETKSFVEQVWSFLTSL